MLAKRMSRVEPSGIRRIFELMSTMDDPINFSIGQAHYDPPEALVEAACRAMRAGHNRYTVTQGLPELNQRLLDRVEARYGRRPDSCFLTSGVSGGILLSFFALLDPDDEILLPDPSFMMYRILANLVGAKIRYYDTYPDREPRFHIDAAQIEQLVGPRTKVVFLNSPSNPTGGVLTEEEVGVLVRAAERVGAYVISDEIYDAFVYEPTYASPVSCYDRVIQLGGFSKTYGVPGWRMGYATGPADVLDGMKTLQQFSFVCAPAPFQYAIAEVALDLDMSGYIEQYHAKRNRLVADLHPDYQLVPPAGSFYAFPRIPSGMGEKAFLDACFAEKVLVVPGSAFSARDTHFRLSFAVTDEDLSRGIHALNGIAERRGRPR
ncbi:MAG: pyridoxal phosphate-dependent aminotransferase [Planctomycetes bacterium]|nr:pyridoxal phosphate-dependent aminotransferase [Planctomycetota bacterium]